jgi:formylglycine-generating enzyme required for sulfatase activity
MRISPLVLLLFATLGCGSEAARVKKQMTSAQLALGDPVVNSVGMLLVPIPAGEFQMGSPASAPETSQFPAPTVEIKGL